MKNQYRVANRLKRGGSDSLKIKGGREGGGLGNQEGVGVLEGGGG